MSGERRIAMPDQLARKRLKKKMLDRWENEGGRLAGLTGADEDTPMSEKGEGRQLPASRVNSTVSTPTSPTKRRKPPRK
jgi:hypothetical protein